MRVGRNRSRVDRGANDRGIRNDFGVVAVELERRIRFRVDERVLPSGKLFESAQFFVERKRDKLANRAPTGVVQIADFVETPRKVGVFLVAVFFQRNADRVFRVVPKEIRRDSGRTLDALRNEVSARFFVLAGSGNGGVNVDRITVCVEGDNIGDFLIFPTERRDGGIAGVDLAAVIFGERMNNHRLRSLTFERFAKSSSGSGTPASRRYFSTSITPSTIFGR